MEAAKLSGIPFVDFSSYSLQHKHEDVPDSVFKDLGDQLCKAFSNIGFVYIKNHGIPQEDIENGSNVNGEFFNLSDDVKQKYNRADTTAIFGYSKVMEEKLCAERPADYKESFDIAPALCPGEQAWPHEELKDYKQFSMKLFMDMHEVSLRILRCIATGLGFEDREFFTGLHDVTNNNCGVLVRFLNYPPIRNALKPNQIRCGEHTDYGTITLLFQDDAGGLQVKHRNGEYLAAPPVPGSMIVNVGDLLQRWSSDKLVSTEHRVLVPETALKSNRARKSIGYFANPIRDRTVECVDGSNKYEPISVGDYFTYKYNLTYGYDQNKEEK